jgi:hypothetical protein
MSLGVIREWNCLFHGEFDGSHPICPAMGCDSAHVVREFRTAPTIGSRMVKQFEAGMKRSSDMMRINNFRTARAGEAAYGGQAEKESGLQVLWGDQCKQALGRSFNEMVGLAAKPLTVTKADGSKLTLTRNNGMAEAATEAGLSHAATSLPPGLLEKPLPRR